MDFNSCLKLIYNFWTKFVKINCSSISKFSGHSGTNLPARQSYLHPTSLQAFTDIGRKMSSDQPDIKFEDADLYEKFMGVWSRMLGSKFIDWMSPDQGISRGVIMFRYLLLRPFTTYINIELHLPALNCNYVCIKMCYKKKLLCQFLDC